MSRDSSASARARQRAQQTINLSKIPVPVIRYTLTYNGNGSTGGILPIDVFSYSPGTSVLVQNASLLKTGFRFIGWNTLSGIFYAPLSRFTITSNVTLYAVWAPTYTVTYASTLKTGGSLPTDSFKYITNEIVTLKGNTGSLTRTNYLFYGWSTSENGIGTFYFPLASFSIVANITLYAIWVPTYTLTYLGGTYTGGTVPTDTNRYASGSTVLLQNTGTMVKANHVFLHWTFLQSGVQVVTRPNNTLTISENLTLTAAWAPVYSVTYYGNGFTGGTVPTDPTLYRSASSVRVKENTLTRTNFRFLEWNTREDGLGIAYAPANRFVVEAPVQLYAIWQELTTLTYDGNGNTEGIVPLDDASPYISGNFVRVQSGTIARTNYRFVNWNTQPNGTGTSYSPSDIFPITVNTTLYAMWDLICTLTYEGNGFTEGVVPASEDYLFTAFVTVGSVGTATKLNSRFVRWNTEANGTGTSYLPFDVFKIENNVTLYAIWEPMLLVTYHGNGFLEGEVPVDPETYLENSVVTVRTSGTLAKPNFRFARWNTEEDDSGTPYLPYDSFRIMENTTLWAVWQTTFTVTYEGNGMTNGVVPVDPRNYLLNSIVVPREMTGTKVKFRFSQWNTSPDGSGTSYVPFQPFTISEPTTLWAIWVPETYRVTYNGTTYSGGNVPAATNYPYDSIVTVEGKNDMYRSGSTFLGWFTDGYEFYVEGDTFTLTQDKTLYASWTPAVYYVTYDANGGTGSVPVDRTAYVYVSNVTTKRNEGLTRVGYTFDGWNTLADGSGTSYSQENRFKITDNVRLYAVWMTDMIKVTYNGNGFTGGSVPAEALYASNTVVTLSGNTGTLVRSGNTFAGWYTFVNNVRTDYVVGSTLTITGDITFYAKWTCTVTYEGNGNTGGEVPTVVTYLNGETVTVTTTTLERTGNTFAGWYTDTQTYVGGNTFTITANVVLYAKWTCTVTYEGNGNTDGSVPNPVTYTNGATATLSANTGSLVRTNTTFSGWYTLVGDTRTPYAVGDTFIITANTTVYANWTCAVTYDGNGSTDGSVPTVEQYLPGSSVTVVGNPGTLVRTNNTFAGWYTFINGTRTPYVEEDTFTITVNTTLYARWTCTVTYEGNGSTGGSAPTTTTHENGDQVTVELHGGMDKTGYTFGGWYNNENGTGTSYTTFAILEDVTLYAKWLIRTYTITYDGNSSTDGSVPDPTSGVYNSTDTVLAGTLVRNQDRFMRWNTSSNGSGTTYHVGDPILYLENITLYAIWEPTYTVTYDANLVGSTGSQTDSLRYIAGESATVKNSGTLAKVGKNTFKEWYSNSTGSNGTAYPLDTLLPITNNITLYAIWTYKITYNGNNNTDGSLPYDESYTIGESFVADGQGSLQNSGTFLGWNTNPSATVSSYTSGTSYSNITEDTTLYAIWQPTGFTVTYLYANGATAATDTSTYSSTFTTKPLPSASYYSWYTEITTAGVTTMVYTKNYYPQTSYAITGNLTLYATQGLLPLWDLRYGLNGGDGQLPPNQDDKYANETVTVGPIASDLRLANGNVATRWRTRALPVEYYQGGQIVYGLPEGRLGLFMWPATD
jgi:uncharacterized repeat protein (TIGR02543 family)